MSSAAMMHTQAASVKPRSPPPMAPRGPLHGALSTYRSLAWSMACQGVVDPLARRLGQGVAARPVISFQAVKRVSISRRYSSAESRWRRGRKCGDIRLK